MDIPHDILTEFCQESQDLIAEMVEVLEGMEEQVSAKGFERYGQLIDRIMGAARSVGLDELGQLCEYGKIIGYKASQSKNPKLLEVTRDILFDATDILEDYFVALLKNKGQSHGLPLLNKINSRLDWLAQKFKDIKRASVSIIEEEASEIEDDFELDDDFDFEDDFVEETVPVQKKKVG